MQLPDVDPNDPDLHRLLDEMSSFDPAELDRVESSLTMFTDDQSSQIVTAVAEMFRIVASKRAQSA